MFSVTRHLARVRVFALLALLSVAAVQHSAAELAIIWRAAILSWDSPATQLQDQVASQGVLSSDPAKQAGEHALAALAPAGLLALPDGVGRSGDLRGTSRLTRSPPAR